MQEIPWEIRLENEIFRALALAGLVTGTIRDDSLLGLISARIALVAKQYGISSPPLTPEDRRACQQRIADELDIEALMIRSDANRRIP